MSLEAVRLKSQCVDSLRRLSGGNPLSVCRKTFYSCLGQKQVHLLRLERIFIMAKLQSVNGVQWRDSRSPRATPENLAEHESSSLGSDSELNGFANTETQTDRYGFIGGAQQSAGEK